MINRQKIKIGVMGSAGSSIGAAELEKLSTTIELLAQSIAEHNCTLITGETSGIPGKVIAACNRQGALTVGISPASSEQEHLDRFNCPEQSSAVVIYSGFGLMGRNVLNIRSSDIVIIFGGSIGTMNEFTIAYDENKIIGVIAGTGGVTDLLPEFTRKLSKPTAAKIFFNEDPRQLVKSCLEAFAKSQAKN